MRLLIDVSFRDRTGTDELLTKTGLLSVNQLAASFKLCEVSWFLYGKVLMVGSVVLVDD